MEGWKTVKVDPHVWRELQLLKIDLNARSVNEVIRRLLAFYKYNNHL